MQWTKRLIAIAMLCAPLMGAECSQTIRASTATDRIVCETADFYRFRPYRSTWAKLTADEQQQLRTQLDAYRRERCPEILAR